jgi:hypothetical protein
LKAARTAVARVSSAPNQMQIDHKIVNPATGILMLILVIGSKAQELPLLRIDPGRWAETR